MKYKICPKCGKNWAVKNWMKRGLQSYRCKKCKHRFQNKKRPSRREKKIRDEYSLGKQTYKQLWEKYACSRRTIARIIDKQEKVEYIFYNDKLRARSTYIIMDVSCFWTELLVFMLKSVEYKKVIYAKVVERECVEEYALWVAYIEERWWKIRWITTDGFKWVRQLFSYLPYQMCVFHQVAIITRCVWKYPKIRPHQELRKIALSLKDSTYWEVKVKLDQRYKKWWDMLSERSYNLFDNKKWWYTHKNMRRAYRSLVTNLPYLFIYQSHQWMPNTTNALDWYFRPLKSKLWVYSWLTKDRKIRLLFKLLSA